MWKALLSLFVKQLSIYNFAFIFDEAVLCIKIKQTFYEI